MWGAFEFVAKFPLSSATITAATSSNNLNNTSSVAITAANRNLNNDNATTTATIPAAHGTGTPWRRTRRSPSTRRIEGVMCNEK